MWRIFANPLDGCMNVPRWFEFKLNSFYAEIWPFGCMMIVDCIVAVGRGIRCHWIDTVCVEFRKLTDSKCIRVENWKRPVRFHTQRVRVYMPINQNLPVNRCIPVWLSTFDSQNREEKRTKLLTYVKHVVQMIFEIGYNSSMVFHYSICALAQHGFGFWIKRMHQNHSSNMSLKTLSSLFDLYCLLSWACQSQRKIFYSI